MKFKDYITENTMNGRFFISPKGELIGLGDEMSHIDVITSNPKKFGITSKYVKSVYDKYDEMMGLDGRAREEIIETLIKNGWIHLRKRPRDGWIINAWKMTKKIRDLLTDWSTRITKGINGVKELNILCPVTIITIKGNYLKKLTIKKLQQHILQEANEIGRAHV